MSYTVRRAGVTETTTVVGLLTARTEWLDSRGHDQWSKKDPTRTTATTVAAGETWLLLDDVTGHPVGTVTMSTKADLDFWWRNDLERPALYLTKMATDPTLSGRGLGSLLVYAAWRYARRRGVSLLRWDSWRTNEGLQNYYKGLGARLVRTVEVPNRNSGALFEWRYRDLYGEPREASALRVDAPRGTVAEVPSVVQRRQPASLGDDNVQTDQDADHWHEVPDIVVPSLSTDWPRRPEPLTVIPGQPGPRLFHSGDRWRAEGVVTRPVTGQPLDWLTAGRLYQLDHETTGDRCRVVVRGDLLSADAAGS